MGFFHPSDSELIEGCLAGRKESWDLFVSRFSRLVHWAARRALEKTAYSAREDVIADVFQETFRRLLERAELEKLREPSSLRKFLTVMAAHAAYDRAKNLARLDRKILYADTATWENWSASKEVSKTLETSETAETVRAAVDALVPKERACVEMSCVDGRTHREIALILGLSQDTVSTLIRRAKDKLRKTLERKGYGPVRS